MRMTLYCSLRLSAIDVAGRKGPAEESAVPHRGRNATERKWAAWIRLAGADFV